MDAPKYQVGQEVEAQWNSRIGNEPATITGIKYTYTVKFNNHPYDHQDKTEDQIRPPRPSEEEAWEKATMLIGKRVHEKAECCLYSYELPDFDKATRHQVYQILGSAGIKITDELKRDVRRLIQVADTL